MTLGSFPVRHPTSESAHRAAAPKGNHPSRCARRLESAVTLGSFPCPESASESAHGSAAPKGNHPSRCARGLESTDNLQAHTSGSPTPGRCQQITVPRGALDSRRHALSRGYYVTSQRPMRTWFWGNHSSPPHPFHGEKTTGRTSPSPSSTHSFPNHKPLAPAPTQPHSPSDDSTLMGHQLKLQHSFRQSSHSGPPQI